MSTQNRQRVWSASIGVLQQRHRRHSIRPSADRGHGSEWTSVRRAGSPSSGQSASWSAAVIEHRPSAPRAPAGDQLIDRHPPRAIGALVEDVPGERDQDLLSQRWRRHL